MKVAIRNGRIVRLRVCIDCGHEGICDPDPNISEFRRHGKAANGETKYDGRCKPCARKLQKEYRASRPKEIRYGHQRGKWERTKADPERLARRRARDRERKARLRRDPEQYAKMKARNREWTARQRTENREAFLEGRRMEYRLRQERRGKPVRPHKTVVDGTVPVMSAAPIRAWLLAYQDATGIPSGEALADDLGLVNRRVRGILNGEQANVSIDVVDTALMHASVEVDVAGVAVFGLDDLELVFLLSIWAAALQFAYRKREIDQQRERIAA